MAAETSVGLTLTALLWARPLKPILSTLALLVAIRLAVLLPVDADFLRGFGAQIKPTHPEALLRASALLTAVACILSGRPILAVTGVATSATLVWLRTFITNADWDVAGAYLVGIGLVVGVHYATSTDGQPRAQLTSPRDDLKRDDLILFVLTTALAVIVAIVVLHKHTNSGDEWADTFQAALFSKLRAYSAVPPCSEAFQSTWVFQYLGRSFAQYTPGWPLFMTPFVLAHAVWLASPVALGILAVGAAWLARRAVREKGGGRRQVRAAGLFAGLSVALGSTMLINGASRYSHVFVAAMFVWSVEALLMIADRDLRHAAQWFWGAVLGTAAAFMITARLPDGATLGIGLFLYAVYAAVRRRFGLRAAVATLVAFGVWVLLTLVILRLQIGVWGKTGYSLTGLFHEWAVIKVTWALPKPADLLGGVPLASGSYCWWPCSAAIGLAGVAALRGKARRIAFILVMSLAPFVAAYTLIEGEGNTHFGYGPRYQLPCVVGMAVGTGVMLSELWASAVRRVHAASAFRDGGPMALALAASLLGILRIAPLVYPYTYTCVLAHNRVREAIEAVNPHHALVLAQTFPDVEPHDLTEDLPLELFPDQDIIVALRQSPEMERCIRDHFPDRTYYEARAVGETGAKLVRVQ